MDIIIRAIRYEKLLSELIFYINELKKHDSDEERELFWKEVIGLTDEEMKHFGILHYHS